MDGMAPNWDCWPELVFEQQSQFGAMPSIIGSTVAASPHHWGCVIYFRRAKPVSKPIAPSWQDRLTKRLRHLVRVDVVVPSVSESDKDQPLWKAYCRPPCLSDSDCDSMEGWKCVGRPGDHPTAANTPKAPRRTCHPELKEANTNHDMVVISGADASYFEPLQNLAASLYFWSPFRKLVVYNLGLDEEQMRSVESWPNLLEIKWKSGIPASYPDHVRDNLHNYAWKSIIINETVHEYRSIFWLDAGATFVGPLDPIEEILHRRGLFLVKGQDEDMKLLSHGTLPFCICYSG